MSPIRQWVTVHVLLVLSDAVDVTAGVGDGRSPTSSSISSSVTRDVRENAAINDDAIVGVRTKIQAWQEDVHSHSQFDGAQTPFVTLTYAQSLDGCVAVTNTETGETSSNLPLSGKSSLRLTHGLRSIHDAVLVGGTTFAVDNPRLNVRVWPRGEGGKELSCQRQPRPVVLDTELKSLKKAGDRCIRAQNPIICCAQDVFDAGKGQLDSRIISKVDILPCKRESEGRGLDLEDVLLQLRDQKGICSVMVEGGASILTAFANKGLAHCICITIAPKLIGGKNGLNAFAGYESRGREGLIPWCNFEIGGSDCAFVPGIGSDCIFLARWPRDNADSRHKR